MPIDIFGRTNNTSARAQKSTSLYLDTKHFLRHDGSVSASSSLNMDGNAIKKNYLFQWNQLMLLIGNMLMKKLTI